MQDGYLNKYLMMNADSLRIELNQYRNALIKARNIFLLSQLGILASAMGIPITVLLKQYGLTGVTIFLTGLCAKKGIEQWDNAVDYSNNMGKIEAVLNKKNFEENDTTLNR